MCGFAGFLNFKADFLYNEGMYDEILENMCNTLYHRGQDEKGKILTKEYGMTHTRLSIIDVENGKQPMTARFDNNTYRIVYNGEIYNTKEIREELIDRGWIFETNSDTEVILIGFIEFGIEIVNILNGIFAFFVVDEGNKVAYLVRDQIGVKPLYYTEYEGTLVFSSEIKGIFEFPELVPKIDMDGLNEVISLGPAKTYGSGVFKGIKEVKPGHYLEIDYNDIYEYCYWKLVAMEHEENYEKTIEKTRFLVEDSIKRQMVSDVPIATFLSGGIDSSIVSSVCAKELDKKGDKLGTFSFEFTDNEKHYRSNAFQPSLDRPYVDIMVNYIKSEHRYLECDNDDLFENLFETVDARDLPTMADVDSSLLYFCKQVKPFYKVVLTGECADEVFGGYPWFHKKEFFEANTFPWSMDISARKSIFKDELINELKMEDYIRKSYRKTVEETPVLTGEIGEEKRRREISYLNIKWFMQTLLDRMDRCSMYSGIEARVPFADIRIMQYLYNVPWEMKAQNGVEKSLLREAMKDYLPKEILNRKKSPYPKTYDPAYEKKLSDALIKIIENKSSPINGIIDKKKVYSFIGEKKDYGKPWYGQLMAGPQMLAYLLQINYWMEKYKVKI